MKQILIGILVGSLSTISTLMLYKKYQAEKFKVSAELLGVDDALDRSTDVFFATANSDEFLLIPRENPLLVAETEVHRAVNGTNTYIRIRDRDSICLFVDKDGDSKWDWKIVHVNRATYYYSSDSGYPIEVRTESNSMVRIGDVYYDVNKIDGKTIILQDGEKFEVDYSDLGHLTLESFVSETNDAAGLDEPEIDIKQYQMEAIRSGMPPLPIPLTQEMDDQLVKEGVLPPMEE